MINGCDRKILDIFFLLWDVEESMFLTVYLSNNLSLYLSTLKSNVSIGSALCLSSGASSGT